MLVEQPQCRGAIGVGRAGFQPRNVGAEHAHAPGRESLEAGDDAEERRLAGAARPEQDDDLTELHVERETLQRGCSAGRRVVDEERVADGDGGRHSRLQDARSGESPRNA